MEDVDSIKEQMGDAGRGVGVGGTRRQNRKEMLETKTPRQPRRQRRL